MSNQTVDRVSTIVDILRTRIYTGAELKNFFKNTPRDKKVTFNVKVYRTHADRVQLEGESLKRITEYGDITLSSNDIPILDNLVPNQMLTDKDSIPKLNMFGRHKFADARHVTLFYNKYEVPSSGTEELGVRPSYFRNELGKIFFYDIDSGKIIGNEEGTLYLVPKMFGGKKTRRGRKRTSRKNRKSRRRV